MGLAKDEDKRTMQVFTPRAIVAVVATVPYDVVANNVKAFAVGAACTYYLDSDSTAATLAAGQARGVHPDVTTITFDTSMNIEIM